MEPTVTIEADGGPRIMTVGEAVQYFQRLIIRCMEAVAVGEGRKEPESRVQLVGAMPPNLRKLNGGRR